VGVNFIKYLIEQDVQQISAVVIHCDGGIIAGEPRFPVKARNLRGPTVTDQAAPPVTRIVDCHLRSMV
jgi:hypothetical protein